MWYWSVLILGLGLCASANDLASRLPAGYEFIIPRFSTSFNCNDRGLGYYADVDLECTVFHLCNPAYRHGRLIKTYIHSFICPNGTLFSQDYLTCMPQDDAFPCHEAPNIYDESNAGVGYIPSEEEKKNKKKV